MNQLIWTLRLLLTPVSMFREAVFQLLDHHQNVRALIAEASMKVGPAEVPHVEQAAVDAQHGAKTHNTGGIGEQPPPVTSLLAVLYEQSQLSGSPVQTLAASFCAANFRDILRDSQGMLMLSDDQQGPIRVLITLIHTVQRQHGFSRNLFVKLVNKECTLPTEFIWTLHNEGIMLLDSYITCNLSRPEVVGKLSHAIAQLCYADLKHSQNKRKEIVSDLVGYLIKLGYGDRLAEDSTARGLRKVSCALLDSITKKIFSGTSSLAVDIALYETSFAVADVDSAVLKRFANRQLATILSTDPSLKVSHALNQQHNWSYAKMPGHITSLYIQLLVLYEASEVLRLLENVLAQHEVNWKSVLSLTATILVCFAGASSLLKDTIDQMLKKGLENSELDSLIMGFLLARQAALEGPHVFQTYQEWFADTFGDAVRSSTSSKRTFAFLMKFLTNIVPYEEPQYLKAHLLKPPHVPPKCRPILSDYVALARTRLLDLKEPLEELGIYAGNRAQPNVDVERQAFEDVERALDGFEKTGKVPSTIMEASIFRKPYFIGRFLPALLAPRVLPDIPDVRMKFIAAIARAVPPSMFATYEEACKKKAAELLEGVFNIDDGDDDDDMADMLLSPWQQFYNCLEVLQQAVARQQGQQKLSRMPSVSSHLSQLSEKLGTLTGESERKELVDTTVELDVDDPTVGKTASQICAAILDAIHHVISRDEAMLPLTWLSQLLAVITQHPGVHRALLLKIWNMLTQEGPVLAKHHTVGLSAIILQVATTPAAVENVAVKQGSSAGPYVEQLLKGLRVTNKAWMEFCLEFCTSYLQHAVNHYTDVSLSPEPGSGVVHPLVLRLFLFLAPRLYPEVRHQRFISNQDLDVLHKDTVKMYCNTQVLELARKVKFCLKDWAAWELSILCHEDCLDPLSRQNYQDWCIKQYFLPRPTAQGGCEGSVHSLCSALIEAILACRPAANSGKCVGNLCWSGWSDGILLLQRCVLLLPSTTSPVYHEPNAPAWLLMAYKQCCKEKAPESSMVQEQAQTLAFFSAVQCLPAYLFLSNQAHGKGTTLPTAAWEDFVKLVNGPIRNHLSTGLCLSQSITIHILNCLVQVPKMDANQTAVNTTLSQCPVIWSSVINHWQSLEYLFSTELTKTSAISHAMQKVKAVVSAVVRMLDGELHQTEDCQPPWLLGIALFVLGTLRKNMDWQDLFQHITTSSSGFKILESFQECMLAWLTWHHLCGDLSPEQQSCTSTLQMLWCQCPLLLVQLASDFKHVVAVTTAWPTMFSFPDVVQRLLPATSWKVLLNGGYSLESSVYTDAANVQGLLRLHCHLGHLYESAEADNHQEMRAPQLLLSVQLLTEANRFMKKALCTVPGAVLQALPEELVLACDEDIRNLIQRLLAQH